MQVVVAEKENHIYGKVSGMGYGWRGQESQGLRVEDSGLRIRKHSTCCCGGEGKGEHVLYCIALYIHTL